MSYFNVRRVEVVGAHWLAPDSVLQLAAIGSDRSVWEDYADEERRLEAHPLIEEARIRRVGFHGLSAVVREAEPIALVGVPDLRAVRGDGTLLPIDPLATSLDLPVLSTTARLTDDSLRLREGPALQALEIFSRIQALDPGLTAVISDFELLEPSGLAVNLVASQPARRLTLPGEVDEALVRRLRATLVDMRSRGMEGGVMEARYAEQIVVRRERQ